MNAESSGNPRQYVLAVVVVLAMLGLPLYFGLASGPAPDSAPATAPTPEHIASETIPRVAAPKVSTPVTTPTPVIIPTPRARSVEEVYTPGREIVVWGDRTRFSNVILAASTDAYDNIDAEYKIEALADVYTPAQVDRLVAAGILAYMEPGFHARVVRAGYLEGLWPSTKCYTNTPAVCPPPRAHVVTVAVPWGRASEKQWNIRAADVVGAPVD